MTPYYESKLGRLYHGDCLEIMPGLDPVDAIVTDPPYGLGFMGKGWDHGVPGVEYWEAALRVAKPGAHLLAFGGTRKFHRLACAIEDAGWELRDSIGVAHESGDYGDCPWLLAWGYGSGFPKSLDVSKAIDKAAGAHRTERIGVKPGHEKFVGRDNMKSLREGTMSQEGGFSRPWMHDPEQIEAAHHITAPATDAAREWSGWGTALKPSWEPIILARKPIEGTVAQNVLKYGTGALNIDGCRVETGDNLNGGAYAKNGTYRHDGWGMQRNKGMNYSQPSGRWPANLIHDGSDEVVGLFPTTTSGGKNGAGNVSIWGGTDNRNGGYRDGDSGSAARFFYCAKSSRRDRNEGLPEGATSTHPTVKPTALMRYLCRLVTPPGGTVLDPFMGSGSTGKAAVLEGFNFVGIELESEYVEIAAKRIDAESRQLKMF